VITTRKTQDETWISVNTGKDLQVKIDFYSCMF